MKIANVLLGVVLLAGPAAAQSGGMAGEGSCNVGQSLSSLWKGEALEGRALFLSLSELVGGQGSGRTLTLEFVRNGKPIASEEFLLPGEAVGDVEILARHRDLLERIYKLVEGKEPRLNLKVRVDSRVVRELSFENLAAESRELQERGLKPLALKSRVIDRLAPAPPRRRGSAEEISLLAKGYQPDPSCMQDCYDQYEGCKNGDLCNSCPTCDELINQCISWCPQTCVDPAGVSERTEREVVGLQLVDYGCYEDRWQWDFQHGHEYSTYYYTFKYTTYRRTYYCNGSYTDEVINVSYYSDYCSSPGWTCYSPGSWAPEDACPL